MDDGELAREQERDVVADQSWGAELVLGGQRQVTVKLGVGLHEAAVQAADEPERDLAAALATLEQPVGEADAAVRRADQAEAQRW